jgi:NTE family protein
VNQTEIPFWANAVDIQAGKEFTIRDGTLVECVRASIALPGLLPPATRGPSVLMDAGIMDPVPLPLVQAMGANFTIAINAMAKPESRPVSKRYPLNALDVMTRAMFLMGHEIGQARVEEGADITFTPVLDGITMLQFNRSAEIIERGRVEAQANLPAIQTGYAKLKEKWESAKKP